MNRRTYDLHNISCRCAVTGSQICENHRCCVMERWFIEWSMCNVSGVCENWLHGNLSDSKSLCCRYTQQLFTEPWITLPRENHWCLFCKKVKDCSLQQVFSCSSASAKKLLLTCALCNLEIPGMSFEDTRSFYLMARVAWFLSLPKLNPKCELVSQGLEKYIDFLLLQSTVINDGW